jgi:hypothetical protein
MSTMSEELSAQAEQLQTAIDFFKLNEGTAGGAGSRTPLERRVMTSEQRAMSPSGPQRSVAAPEQSPRGAGFTLKMDHKVAGDGRDGEFEKF